MRLLTVSSQSLFGGADTTAIDDFGCTHIFELKKDADARGVKEAVQQGIVYMLNFGRPGECQQIGQDEIAQRLAGFWSQRRLNREEVDATEWSKAATLHRENLEARPIPEGLVHRRTHLHIVIPGLQRLVGREGIHASDPLLRSLCAHLCLGSAARGGAGSSARQTGHHLCSRPHRRR